MVTEHVKGATQRMKPPTFDRKSPCTTTYLKHFEAAATVDQWGLLKKAQEFALALREDTRAHLSSRRFYGRQTTCSTIGNEQIYSLSLAITKPTAETNPIGSTATENLEATIRRRVANMRKRPGQLRYCECGHFRS